MKILFLSQVLPYPLDAGPKIRSYYVLRYLAEHHDVILLSFSRQGDDEHIPHLRQFCRDIKTVPIRRSRYRDALYLFKSLVRKKPFLVVRDDLSEMHKAIRELHVQEQFDAVHSDQLNMGQYATSLTNIFRVLDEHNAVFTIVERLGRNETLWVRKRFLELEARKMRTYETNLVQHFDKVICVTPEDRIALGSACKNLGIKTLSEIRVIPICVDPETAVPASPKPFSEKIICIGNMFYPPNVDGVLWFTDKVLPLIVKDLPGFKFLVVGARPASALLKRAKNNSHLLVTGYVANALPYMNESAAFIVPIRSGGGMRVKILDAWAHGMPVVSTSIGCEGINVRPNQNIVIADSPEELAAAVIRILRDPSFARNLGDNGKQWVKANYDWRTQYKAFDEIYPLN